MENNRGIRSLLTLPWVYNAYQNLVGATAGRRWVCEHFWRLQPGQRVLDIGCGPGSAIQLLPDGVQYVGFDISEDYIRHAQRRFAGQPDKTFVLGSPDEFIASTPNAMKNADLVVMNGLLHHLDDQSAITALKLARATLAPQGRLVALEGTYLVRQARLSRWFVGLDRGRNVRSEPEWRALTGKVFDRFNTCILTGLDRTPYTYIVIEATLG